MRGKINQVTRITGTRIPTSGKHCIASRSPLTGIWGESDVGGSWGFHLKKAGFDGVVVIGADEKPVYIWIHNEQVEIRDTTRLWGTDTYDVESILKWETDEKASVSCIGQAGEMLVKFAAIMHDGKNARAPGRCGLGAVMGSKSLKEVTLPPRLLTHTRGEGGTVPIEYLSFLLEIGGALVISRW